MPCPPRAAVRSLSTGHSEYDALTLEQEFLRDKNKGLPIAVPKNYYPDDDYTKPPRVTWRSCANLLYSNWLNYFVYQTTPMTWISSNPWITVTGSFERRHHEEAF